MQYKTLIIRTRNTGVLCLVYFSQLIIQDNDFINYIVINFYFSFKAHVQLNILMAAISVSKITDDVLLKLAASQ